MREPDMQSTPTVSICVSTLQGPMWSPLIAERGQLHGAKTCGQYMNDGALDAEEASEQSPAPWVERFTRFSERNKKCTHLPRYCCCGLW